MKNIFAAFPVLLCACAIFSPVWGGDNLVPDASFPVAGRTRGNQQPDLPQMIPQSVLDSGNAAIDQEMKGNFPAMDRRPSLPLGTLQKGWEKPVPSSGQTAPGIVHYMWHPDFVMGVRTRDFMVTTVILPQWESINEYYVGDSVIFEIKKIKSNVIAMKARNSGADSNMTIIGSSGNVYNFYIRSESWNSTQITDIAIYVEGQRNDSSEDFGHIWSGNVASTASLMAIPSGTGDAVGNMPDYLRRIVVRPEDIRFDVKMYARSENDAEIAPERAFEDGVFTYFDFGERSDNIARPVVHQLVDGVDAIVNTRTAGPRGNVLIAEATGDFTLRNGNRVVCVRRISKRIIPAAVVIDPDAISTGRNSVRGGS